MTPRMTFYLLQFPSFISLAKFSGISYSSTQAPGVLDPSRLKFSHII